MLNYILKNYGLIADILGIAILTMVFSCDNLPYRSREAPFYNGFERLRWGSGLEQLDSMVTHDSSWNKISIMAASSGSGISCIVQNKGQIYYLDYNALRQLYAVNFIVLRDSSGNMDTLVRQLTTHYGPADISRPQPSYEKYIWSVNDPTCALDIQLIATERQFAFHIRNLSISE